MSFITGILSFFSQLCEEKDISQDTYLNEQVEAMKLGFKVLIPLILIKFSISHLKIYCETNKNLHNSVGITPSHSSK